MFIRKIQSHINNYSVRKGKKKKKKTVPISKIINQSLLGNNVQNTFPNPLKNPVR